MTLPAFWSPALSLQAADL